MKLLRINKTYLTVTALFIFYIFMAMLTPLTHDDWDWYSHYGIQMLQERFTNLNGRYLGNMLEIIAVRLDWLRWLSYAVFSISIIWIIGRFVNEAKILYYLCAFILMLTIPSDIYKQTYGWFAGFYNYVPATFCVLFIIWYISTILFKQKNLDPITNILFYCVCFLGQFFMENTTLFNTMILILAIVLHILIYRKLNPKFILGLAISSLGTILMFINPNYRKIFFEGNSYQKVSSDTGIIDKVTTTITTVLPDWVVFNQMTIILMIIGVAIALLFRNATLFTRPKWMQALVITGLLILPIYYFFIYEQFALQNFHILLIANLVNTFVCIWFLSAFILAIHIVVEPKEVKYTLYLLLAAVLLVCAPLVIVSPLGPRNFYTVSALFVIIFLMLFSQLNITGQLWKRIVGVIAIGSATFYLGTFSYINQKNETRITQLKEEIQAHPKKEFYTMEKITL
ncbi:DUF6056 family protein [Staphylococcus pseudoxylosus]|uniref:DUF6056 family protein n=1 Tax=Staphylococcus pseudoxylosus TaxID=2282419 RepID=UPI00398AEA5A